MVVFAPIPKLSTASAEKVNPGFFRSMRSECVSSFKRSRMIGALKAGIGARASPREECRRPITYAKGADEGAVRVWDEVSAGGGQDDGKRSNHQSATPFHW